MIKAVKTREKLTRLGKQKGFSDLELSLFWEEALLTRELKHIYIYIINQHYFGMERTCIVDEIKFILSIYERKKDFEIYKGEPLPFIFSSLLPHYCKDELSRQKKRWIAKIDYGWSRDRKILVQNIVKLIKMNAHPKRIMSIMKIALRYPGYDPMGSIISFYEKEEWVKDRLLLPEDEILSTLIEKRWSIQEPRLDKLINLLPDEEILKLIQPRQDKETLDSNGNILIHCHLNQEKLKEILQLHNPVIKLARNIYREFTSDFLYMDDIKPDVAERIANAMPDTNGEIYIRGKTVYYDFSISVNDSGIISMWFGQSCKLWIKKSNGNIAWNLTERYPTNLVVFDEESLYEKVGKGEKLIPLTFKTISKLYTNPYFRKFMDALVSKLTCKYPILNDIMRWLTEDGYILMPLNFIEVLKHHNLKGLFHEKHRVSRELHYRWNVRDVNLSYLIIKSWNYVKPEMRNKLLQVHELPDSFAFCMTQRVKDKVLSFLVWYLSRRIGEKDESFESLLKDYVRMCFMMKEKVNICIRSAKRIQSEHDRLSNLQYMKATPLISVNTDTKFNELRRILPQEYEWIRTRKRLVHEAVIQCHCVWSYAEYINKDVCQIYSYISQETGERYTLEFRIRCHRYVCVQAQGKHNKADVREINRIKGEVETIFNEYYGEIS